MGSDSRKTITIHDLTGLGPFLERHDVEITLKKEVSGRVVGVLEASPEAYRLMGEFQSNPEIRLLDFLADQRRLRGRCSTCAMGADGTRKGETGRMDHIIPNRSHLRLVAPLQTDLDDTDYSGLSPRPEFYQMITGEDRRRYLIPVEGCPCQICTQCPRGNHE